MFYTGVCENRLDPLKLGRCQVRILGLHTENKIDLPTTDLPWAFPMMPINSASMSGLGWSPTGVVPGSWVVVIFLDEDQQQPIMIGTIGGIPQTKTATSMGESMGDIVTTGDDGELTNSSGNVITDLVDNIAQGEPTGVLQETSSKYHINSVTTELSTGNLVTYNIISNENDVTISTATYEEVDSLYQVTLLNPESYEESQYTPFNGSTKSFQTTEEILKYFDKNF